MPQYPAAIARGRFGNYLASTKIPRGQAFVGVALMIASKSTAFRLAPPTSAPPTPGSVEDVAGLDGGLTDPP